MFDECFENKYAKTNSLTYLPQEFYYHLGHECKDVKYTTNMLEIIRKPTKWTVVSVEKLHEGVQKQNLRRELNPLLYKLEEIKRKALKSEKDASDVCELEKKVDFYSRQDPKYFEFSIDDLDFNEISNNYLPSFSPLRCQLKWLTCEHPNINSSSWQIAENRKLVELARQCKYRNWAFISYNLNTDRSPLQCFVQYKRYCNSFSSRESLNDIEKQKILEILSYIGFDINYSDIDESEKFEVYCYVSSFIPTKSFYYVRLYIEEILKQYKSRKFTTKLDNELFTLKLIHPDISWKAISKKLGSQMTAEQYRWRYESYLNPENEKIDITNEEAEILISYFNKNLFEKMSTGDFENLIPNRTVPEIKRFYFYLKKTGKIENNDDLCGIKTIKKKRFEPLTLFHQNQMILSQQNFKESFLHVDKSNTFSSKNIRYQNALKRTSRARLVQLDYPLLKGIYIELNGIDSKVQNLDRIGEDILNLSLACKNALNFFGALLDRNDDTYKNWFRVEILKLISKLKLKTYDELISHLNNKKLIFNFIHTYLPDENDRLLNFSLVIDHYFGFISKDKKYEQFDYLLQENAFYMDNFDSFLSIGEINKLLINNEILLCLSQHRHINYYSTISKCYSKLERKKLVSKRSITSIKGSGASYIPNSKPRFVDKLDVFKEITPKTKFLAAENVPEDHTENNHFENKNSNNNNLVNKNELTTTTNFTYPPSERSLTLYKTFLNNFPSELHVEADHSKLSEDAKRQFEALDQLIHILFFWPALLNHLEQ